MSGVPFRPFLLILGALVLGLIQSAEAAPGDLDATFGTGGLAHATIASQDNLSAIAVQSDGKIVVAGYTYSETIYVFALARYTSEGALDVSFGNGGKVMTAIGVGNDRATSVAVQSDGKIVVAGSSANGTNDDFALVRYTSEGVLDASFGSGGKVITDFGPSSVAYGVAVQSNGKIVVAGGTNDFALARYTSEGALDPTFGSGGKVTTGMASGGSGCRGVALQSDGKIVVTGFSVVAGSGKFDSALARYTSDGALDPSFGSGGKVITPNGWGLGVAVQNDGKIVVTGNARNLNDDLALLRYTSEGAPDPSFGTGGKVVAAIGTGSDYGLSVVLQSDRKIVVAGAFDRDIGKDLVLARFTSAGALDMDFGSSGMFTTRKIGNEQGVGVALQSDGKIVIAAGGLGFTVMRFEGSPPNARPTLTLNGSVPLTIEAGVSYADAGATASDPEDGALIPVMTTNTVVPNVPGNYEVIWTATDIFGSSESATRAVTVQDTTAPAINGTFSPLRMIVGTALPDYTTRAVVTDIVGVTSVTQSPPPGTVTSAGTMEVTITANDAANNVASVSFTVSVTPDHPVATALSTTGAAVPNAGTSPRIQAGAKWTTLGPPAINDAGAVAYLGKWTAPAISGPIAVPAQLGSGIFVDETLVVKAGEAVPGAGTGSFPINAVFKSFRDPVIDDGGHVAFLAVIAGAGVRSSNDTVVVSNGRTGSLEVLARKGDEAPGTGGAKYKGFSNLSVQGTQVGGTIFTASLVAGSGNPKVTAAKDSGAWWLPAGESAVLKLVREGDVGFDSNETIKAFTVLSALSGSTGHGRGHVSGDSALVRLSLNGPSGPRQTQAFARPGILTDVVATGDWLRSNTLIAMWKGMNMASFGNQGQGIAMLGSLVVGMGEATSANAIGIFQCPNISADWESVARRGGPAPGLGDGAIFSRFFDPVQSSTDTSLAFLGWAKGGAVSGANDAALWWKPEGGELTLLARESLQPPGAPEGAKWKSFASVALPGNGAGPIFTASLQRGGSNGGITGNSDVALYAMDSFGAIHELIRENQPLAGKVVRSFNILKAASGSAGVTRSFNANHEVVAHVTFVDNTSGIVKIKVP